MERRFAHPDDIRISLAGGFELTRHGRIVDVAEPGQRVLAYLALNDRAVPRGELANVLWTDASPEHAAGSLRSALWRIRQLGDDIVASTMRALRLAADVRVDIREGVEWARRVADESHEARREDAAVASDGGDILPDWTENWVRVERERLRQLRLHALETLSGRLVAASRHGDALEVALIALRSAPLRESAHRAVIGVHLAEGNTCEALRHYETYRDLLRTSLGLEPSHLLRRMVESEATSAVD